MKASKPYVDELERGDRINSLEIAMMQGRLDRRSFLKFASALGLSATAASAMAQKASAIQSNQANLSQNLKNNMTM